MVPAFALWVFVLSVSQLRDWRYRPFTAKGQPVVVHAAKIYGEGWRANPDAGVAERALAAAYLAAGDMNNARRSLERAESALRKALEATRQIHAPNPETGALRSGLIAAANDRLRNALTDLVAALRKSGKNADADKADQRLQACCE